MTHRTAVLHCCYPGCGRTLTIDAAHAENLMAGGGYDCGAHDREEVTC